MHSIVKINRKILQKWNKRLLNDGFDTGITRIPVISSMESRGSNAFRNLSKSPGTAMFPIANSVWSKLVNYFSTYSKQMTSGNNSIPYGHWITYCHLLHMTEWILNSLANSKHAQHVMRTQRVWQFLKINIGCAVNLSCYECPCIGEEWRVSL